MKDGVTGVTRELRGTLDEIAEKFSEDDAAEILETLFADVRSSYRLAMKHAGVSDEQQTEVDLTVTDYVSNTWF